MRSIVLDTSAVVRLYVPDGPLPDGLEEGVDAAWRSEAILLAPELLLAELGQVLWNKERRGEIAEAEADQIHDEALDLPIDLVGHRELLADARALARLRDLTVYDGLFLALAIARGAELITADGTLESAYTAIR